MYKRVPVCPVRLVGWGTSYNRPVCWNVSVANNAFRRLSHSARNQDIVMNWTPTKNCLKIWRTDPCFQNLATSAICMSCWNVKIIARSKNCNLEAYLLFHQTCMTREIKKHFFLPWFRDFFFFLFLGGAAWRPGAIPQNGQVQFWLSEHKQLGPRFLLQPPPMTFFEQRLK